MTIRPLHDRVLVKRKDAQTQTASGLYIPEAAKEKSHLAEVIAVGSGRVAKDGTVTPLKLEPGMTVVLGKWAGDEIEVNGEKQLFIREQDILAAVM